MTRLVRRDPRRWLTEFFHSREHVLRLCAHLQCHVWSSFPRRMHGSRECSAPIREEGQLLTHSISHTLLPDTLLHDFISHSPSSPELSSSSRPTTLARRCLCVSPRCTPPTPSLMASADCSRRLLLVDSREKVDLKDGAGCVSSSSSSRSLDRAELELS